RAATRQDDLDIRPERVIRRLLAMFRQMNQVGFQPTIHGSTAGGPAVGLETGSASSFRSVSIGVTSKRRVPALMTLCVHGPVYPVLYLSRPRPTWRSPAAPGRIIRQAQLRHLAWHKRVAAGQAAKALRRRPLCQYRHLLLFTVLHKGDNDA